MVTALAELPPYEDKVDYQRVVALSEDLIDPGAEFPVPVQRGALVAAEHHAGKGAKNVLMSAARESRLDESVRVTALRLVADYVFITDSTNSATLMRLSADPSPRIAAAAEAALLTHRTGDGVLNAYGIKGSAAAATRSATRLVQTVEKRNQQLQDMLNGSSGRSTPSPSNTDPQQAKVDAMAARLRSGNTTERMAAVYDLGQLGDPARFRRSSQCWVMPKRMCAASRCKPCVASRPKTKYRQTN